MRLVMNLFCCLVSYKSLILFLIKLNGNRERGQKGEDMSSTSFTDQQFMSPQSFYRTFSGSLRNISEEQKEFLYTHLRKLPRNFFITGFSPHTEVKVINRRLLVGTFYKHICFVWDVELDRKSAELGFIHIICKPNIQNEDQQQEEPPFHLEENVVPICQLHNLHNIDSNCLREKWLLLLKKRKKNRGAIAGVFKGDCLIQTFHAEKPRFIKGENTIHYEELLIREMDPYLEKISQELHNGAPEGGRVEILIYIPMSPCCKREKKKGTENKTIVPCVFLLNKSADRWHKKYRCCTYVGFTEYFGPLSSHFFDKILKSQIWTSNSVFGSYTEKSENVCVKLDLKNFQNKISKWPQKQKLQNIQNLSVYIRNCLNNLGNSAQSKRTLNQHLIHGKEIITSSEFDPTVKDLIHKGWCKIWEEVIENKRFELIKEKFKADYNKKFVESFLKHQNYSSRGCIKFCLIEKQHLPTNMPQSDCHSLDDKNLCSPDDCETVISDQPDHF
ncbi:uncharacterized protein LOC127535702 isoform X4 [Acanthochromis polyacanthus]|uniref:uncharacterized protein LOC127535702 isoform X4 n=1 Tax=Acanthochromis polyacanthus TaxID=80966 RepID=UPI002234371F|nr:uncharacterized protein LOC127535702 isoform X4 [Acanthochromis polyacanthus]